MSCTPDAPTQRFKVVGVLAIVLTAAGCATTGERQVLMVAFNSHFDTAFLDHLFRSQERSWRELYHYFVLDLPSMAWSLGIRGLTGANVSDRLGVEDEPRIAEQHTGITGARLNARIYRALVSYRQHEAQ